MWDELETEIPVALYEAVAVIIGFIMRAAEAPPPPRPAHRAAAPEGAPGPG